MTARAAMPAADAGKLLLSARGEVKGLTTGQQASVGFAQRTPPSHRTRFSCPACGCSYTPWLSGRSSDHVRMS